jgi:serine/threonine-protein kinase
MVGHLADVALVQGKAKAELPWFQLCKALAEYRQANFSSAAEWAQKTVAVATPMVKRDAAAYAILAMAQHQLNHAEQAHAALAKAVEITETKMPRLGSGDLGPDWQDWLIAHILLREARELVEGQPVPAGDKTMQ